MKYHKINGLYKRYTEGPNKGKFKDGIVGDEPVQFSQPEFEYLYDNTWIGTEKIDGTNIRIYYSPSELRFEGRTDNAQIPNSLQSRLVEFFEDQNVFHEVFGEAEVVLYGEGFGSKIQAAGSKYIPGRVDFILFDVYIGRMFLKREDVDSIALRLGIKSVPSIFSGTLQEAEKIVRKGFESVVSEESQIAEGMVLTPVGDFRDRRGNRIITKLKYKDFQ